MQIVPCSKKGQGHYLNIPSTQVIKLFSCSTQLSMKFFLLINVKMPTIVGILTFMSRKNSIPGFSVPEKCFILSFNYQSIGSVEGSSILP